MNRTNCTKYTAYLLSLISICSSLAKINAMNNVDLMLALSKNTGISSDAIVSRAYEARNINIGFPDLGIDKIQEFYGKELQELIEKCSKNETLHTWSTEEGFICKLYNDGNLVITTGTNKDGVLKDIFKNHDELKSEVTNVLSEKNVHKIGELTFEGCRNLESLYLPSVREIESHAFKNCLNLKRIYLLSIKEIKPHAFENCRSLSKAWVSMNAKIADCAFNKNTTIKTFG